MTDKEKKTQCAEVLEYMQTRGAITQAEAIKYIGCYRLSARIWDLRHAGHEIPTTAKKARNRHGKMTTFAAYKLAEEGSDNGGKGAVHF